MPDTPNILLIETDSQDGRILGCMDHPAIVNSSLPSFTPHTDALAARGTNFRNMYTNNPICCPSRASMLTGTFTFRCEGWNNYKGLEPGDDTLFDRLEACGYDIGHFGKMDHLSGGHTHRARVSPWTSSALIMKPNYNMAAPKVLESQLERVHDRDWADVDKACDYIQNAAGSGTAGTNAVPRGGAVRPFLCSVGIRQPHPEFNTSRYWLDKVDEDAVDIPQMGSVDEHPVLVYQRVNKAWKHGTVDATVRLARRIYFAQIAEVDAMVGALISALEESGQADNTLVIFLSDHGELAFEHGQFYKMSHFEASARVPLIVAGPGVQADVSLDAPTSLVDLYPTIADVVGFEAPHRLDGNSLVPELHGEASSRPPWVLSEHYDSSLPTGSYMYRTVRSDGTNWKLIALPGYKPMLFDLDNDPDELTNLAPSRSDVLSELDAGLRAVVDYEAVDAKVKRYDRHAFTEWRTERIEAGDYREQMSLIFSGYDDIDEADIKPWTDEDESAIDKWLAEV
jgi:arylsulfatase K